MNAQFLYTGEYERMWIILDYFCVDNYVINILALTLFDQHNNK